MAKKPYVSPDTMERMWQFFLKTSIPRLIEKDRLAAKAKQTKKEVV